VCELTALEVEWTTLEVELHSTPVELFDHTLIQNQDVGQSGISIHYRAGRYLITGQTIHLYGPSDSLYVKHHVEANT
jgi:hypothetical protein